MAAPPLLEFVVTVRTSRRTPLVTHHAERPVHWSKLGDADVIDRNTSGEAFEMRFRALLYLAHVDSSDVARRHVPRDRRLHERRATILRLLE